MSSISLTSNDPSDHYEDEADTYGVGQLDDEAPRQFKVLMLNDDFTPMDFVVEVLMHFFSMDEAQATTTMLEVHHRGKAVCGIFSREIAETKAHMVINCAKQNDHPLRCVIEPE